MSEDGFPVGPAPDDASDPGWDEIPPALAAVARRTGVSLAELIAVRDSPEAAALAPPDHDDQEILLRFLAPAWGAARDRGEIDPQRVAVYVAETAGFPAPVVAAAVEISLGAAPSTPVEELGDALAELLVDLEARYDPRLESPPLHDPALETPALAAAHLPDAPAHHDAALDDPTGDDADLPDAGFRVASIRLAAVLPAGPSPSVPAGADPCANRIAPPDRVPPNHVPPGAPSLPVAATDPVLPAAPGAPAPSPATEWAPTASPSAAVEAAAAIIAAHPPARARPEPAGPALFPTGSPALTRPTLTWPALFRAALTWPATVLPGVILRRPRPSASAVATRVERTCGTEPISVSRRPTGSARAPPRPDPDGRCRFHRSDPR